MPNWQLAVLLLAAVLTGALLPVLFQLAATLREARRRMRSTGERLDRTLEQTEQGVARLNGALSGLEGREQRIPELLDAIGELTEAVHGIASATRRASVIGAAAGPAIASAVQAFRHTMQDAHPEAGNGWDRGAEPETSANGFEPRAPEGDPHERS